MANDLLREKVQIHKIFTTFQYNSNVTQYDRPKKKKKVDLYINNYSQSHATKL